MKISKIVTMKNLDTSKDDEIKLGTKEIREFNFPKKDYIINKVFIDNLWLKIALIIWFLILIVLLIFEKISQNYDLLSVLIFASLTTITIVANFPIFKLYFFDEKNLNIKKKLITGWAWIRNKKAESHKNCTEAEKRDCSFVKKAFEEINKFAIRFYLSHLAAVLALLFMVTLLMAENQPDKISLIIVAGLWVLMEFYLWKIRYFIRVKARMRYNVATRVDNDNALEFSLNGNYVIEE